MKYYVCFQNCIDDYFFEDAPSLEFDSFDSAIRYLVSLNEDSPIPIPKINGELQWYFSNCNADGSIDETDSRDNWLDLYQIINIIPGESGPVTISECYCDDPLAIISMRRTYLLDHLGKVHDVSMTGIEYVESQNDQP